jgi:hypothetical protein
MPAGGSFVISCNSWTSSQRLVRWRRGISYTLPIRFPDMAAFGVYELLWEGRLIDGC